MTVTSWRTGLTHEADGNVLLRGVPVQELMTGTDFAGAAYFFLTGRRPSPARSRILNAVLVAFIDHGLSPAAVITRTVAAAGVPITPALTAGVLSIGDLQTGTGDLVAEFLAEGIRQGGDRSATALAAELVARDRAAGRRTAGYGHPLHGDGDPRAAALLELVRKHQCAGPHLALALAIEDELRATTGRPLRLNLVGTAAAILADLGVDPRLVRVFTVIARAAGLAAHYVEEIDRERGWRLPVAAEDVHYDGPAARALDDVDE